ncbi:MAG: M20/M25/M40 family metallo-hydrolase [Deltaproteobacteria bacterium]|nr:M20/M25/M40 family metallo-hydrolase [Deltaproteobacteria bacterium]
MFFKKFFNVTIVILFIAQSRCSREEEVSREKKSDVLRKNPEKTSVDRVKDDMKYLVSLNGRKSFTADSLKTAEFLKKFMQTMEMIPFKNDFMIKYSDSRGTEQNVFGCLNPVSEKFVLVGAHFDHLGKSGNHLFPGADDNASGVSAVMEIIRLLNSSKEKLNVCFIFFSGEEMGLKGSKAFVKENESLVKKTKLMINLDMVGREFFGIIMKKSSPMGIGIITDGISKNVEKTITTNCEKNMLSPILLGESLIRSFGADYYYDSIPFNKKGIPTIFFSTGLHKDYHAESDTIDKINFDKIVATAKAVTDIIRNLQNH